MSIRLPSASTLTRPALPLYPTAMTGEPHSASYYAATRNDLTERPALRGDLEADVCVVGGGFTGVSTALNDWIKKAEVDRGERAGVRTEMVERLKSLERENREPRTEN